MKTYTFSLLFFLLAGLLFTARGQDTAAALPSIFDRLNHDNDTPVKITLTTDMRRLIRRKHQETYQPATFTYQLPDQEPVTFEIKVRSRGNRRKEVCFYPPLKLNFRKRDLEAAGLSRAYDDIKFVMQCNAHTPSDQYTWREFLAYRLYNHLSDYSLRVQAVELILRDSRGKAKDRPMAAFLVEPEAELAQRLNAVTIERTKCVVTTLQREPFLTMAAFQYMIGNTDWYVYNVHNLALLKVPEYPRMVPVPYDFDYAGIVDANYAIPFHTLPISDVKERLYTGEPCTEEEAAVIREHFLARQEAIMTYFESFPFLRKNDHRFVLHYLEGFFKMIEDPKKAASVFGKR